jgi:DNA-binding NtrC family response regulator
MVQRRKEGTTRWDRPDEFDHVLLLAGDPPVRDALGAHLARVPGRPRPATPGSHPRFRLVTASNGDEALRRAGAQVTAAAVELVLPRRSGLEVIGELRARRPELAILAFTAGAPAAEAVAAIMAGADFFHECREEPDAVAFERALELAIDRRWLTRLIEKNEAEVEAARIRLAHLSGDLARALPGFRAPQSRDDVIPFKEAARRYLDASARLHAGDTRGLAERLGISYFALRRLLARYGVPLPSRARGSGGHGTRGA